MIFWILAYIVGAIATTLTAYHLLTRRVRGPLEPWESTFIAFNALIIGLLWPWMVFIIALAYAFTYVALAYRKGKARVPHQH